MSSPADMIERLDRLNIREQINQALEESKPALIKAQRAQMLASTLSNDAAIMPKYSPKYAKKKGFTDPDLFLTGTMQEEIIVEVTDAEVRFDTGDPDKEKVARIEGLYTDKIWSLGSDAKETVQKVIEPIFYENVKESLLL